MSSPNPYKRELFSVLRNQKSKCTPELIIDTSPELKNRRIQCELLNMKKPSTLEFRKKFGAGVYGTVNRFTLTSDEYVPNLINEAKNDNLAIKTKIPTERNKAGNNMDMTEENLNNSKNDLYTEEYYSPELEINHMGEALIGLKLSELYDMTPNFPYYHDIRQLKRQMYDRNRIMNVPFIYQQLEDSEVRELDLEDGNYGIITETINGITFLDFLKMAKKDNEYKKKIPNILRQILFTLYIAIKELGFVHFDLHTENILITETDKSTINYTVPLDQQSIQDSKDNKSYDYYENKEDLYRKETIHNQNLPRYDKDIYVGMDVKVKTNGNLVKIIDFGFSTMYIDDKWELNDETKYFWSFEQYDNKDVQGKSALLPNRPSMFFDISRLLCNTYTHFYNNPLHEDIMKLFGDYGNNLILALKRRPELYDKYGRFHILFDSYVIHTVSTRLMTEDMYDHEKFMNKCLRFINNLEININKEIEIQKYYCPNDISSLFSELKYDKDKTRDFLYQKEIVKSILTRPGIDPSIENNLPVVVASSMGRTDIVELLLNDRRVNPTVRDHEALMRAQAKCDVYVVELLLKWYAKNNVDLYKILSKYKDKNHAILDRLFIPISMMYYNINKFPNWSKSIVDQSEIEPVVIETILKKYPLSGSSERIKVVKLLDLENYKKQENKQEIQKSPKKDTPVQKSFIASDKNITSPVQQQENKQEIQKSPKKDTSPVQKSFKAFNSILNIIPQTVQIDEIRKSIMDVFIDNLKKKYPDKYNVLTMELLPDLEDSVIEYVKKLL
jgi:hypothetical protein